MNLNQTLLERIRDAVQDEMSTCETISEWVLEDDVLDAISAVAEVMKEQGRTSLGESDYELIRKRVSTMGRDCQPQEVPPRRLCFGGGIRAVSACDIRHV